MYFGFFHRLETANNSVESCKLTAPNLIKYEIFSSTQCAAVKTNLEEIIDSDVKTYDNYITGEVYQYTIYEIETCNLGHTHKNVVESCGGYFGEEECENEGKSVLQHLEKEVVV